MRVERGDDGHFRFVYADGAEFAIDATGSEIFGVAGGELTEDDLVVYLQGPILGFRAAPARPDLPARERRGHRRASGGVAGAGGMGKSTTAAGFARLGLEVAHRRRARARRSDRVVRGPAGAAAGPAVAESVAALFGHTEALPRIVGTWDKRYLDLTQPGYRFASEAVPSRRHVRARRSPARGRRAGDHAARRRRAPLWLLANTYANDFLDSRMRVEELEVLGRLATTCRYSSCARRTIGARCRVSCEAVLDHFRARGTTPLMFSLDDFGTMIADRVRLDAHAEALRRVVTPSTVVVDIGAGTGIMSLLACKFGARRVYAVEPSPAVQILVEAARDNGYADRIVVLQRRSNEVTLPERADVIVSDLRGVLPRSGTHFADIVDARERLLANGGRLVPATDTVWIAPVSAQEAFEERRRPWQDSGWAGLCARLSGSWAAPPSSTARAPKICSAPPRAGPTSTTTS